MGTEALPVSTESLYRKEIKEMKETSFQKRLREKYGESELSQYDKDLYDWLYDGPKHYGNDSAMEEFYSENPDATLADLDKYWESITPPGLAPGDDGNDLQDDGEDDDE